MSTPVVRATEAASRLATLEAGFKGVQEDIRGLSGAMSALAIETRAAITTLGDRFAAAQQTPWARIIGFASVGLTIISMAAAWVWQNQARADRRLDLMEATYPSIVRNEERISNLIVHTGHLDDVLQREMRLVNEKALTMIADLRGERERATADLDRRLQNEMGIRNDAVMARIAALEAFLRGTSLTDRVGALEKTK